MIRIETSADNRFRVLLNPSAPPGARVIKSIPLPSSGSTAIIDAQLRKIARDISIEVR